MTAIKVKAHHAETVRKMFALKRTHEVLQSIICERL